MVEQVSNLKTGVKYKDTLAGRVPIDWEVSAFSEIAEINPKRTLKKRAVYPFVEMAALDSDSHGVKFTRLRKYEGGGTKFQNGDTLFARITPCTENGKTAFIDFLEEKEFGHGSTEFIVLGPKDNVNPKFIYYSTKWDKVRNIAIAKMEGTSGRQRVPSRVFTEDIFIPIPPFPEQKKIAEILTTADEAIEKTTQIIENAERLKNGVMQRLLTRGIGHKKFKKTAIGEVPVDWEVVRLRDISQRFYNGGTPDTTNKDYWDGNIPWVTGADFENQKVTRIRKYITHEGVKNSATNVIENGELLVVTRTGVGKLAVAPFKIAISQDITGVILDQEKALPIYVYWYLNHNENRLRALIQGTSINGLLRGDLESFVVPLPPLLEQKKIAEILSSADDEVKRESDHKEQLELLKRGLLQVLLTGKIRVTV
jgi:type I restriction enzyme S subunit